MKTIKELRLEQSLTLAQVGERIGVSAQAVHYWESGQDTPNVRRLRQLAEVFGVCSDHIHLPKLNGTAPADDPGPP